MVCACFFFLMVRRPPRSHRTATLLPSSTLFRSAAHTLPLPEIQIFGGGAHAAGRVDLQDFMVTAVGAADYEQALDWTAEVYRAAGDLMREAGLLAGRSEEHTSAPQSLMRISYAVLCLKNKTHATTCTNNNK